MVIKPKGNEKMEEVERNFVLSLLKSEISLIFAEVVINNNTLEQ
jgi:hypothetical protein